MPHRLQECPIRNEEDNEGDEDAMEQADEEVLVVEQQPLLTRQIELGKFEAQSVIHVLRQM